jgi:competence protein ComEA
MRIDQVRKMMKRLLRLFAFLLTAYIVYRILAENLRPTRVRIDERPASVPPSRESTPVPEPTETPLHTPIEDAVRLNVNQADATALTELPGVGPTLAERILAHRQEIGQFTSLDDLTQVQGIGPVLAERLGPFVVFH